MSFAMESTRYCCYDKEKFGNDLSFIFPLWLKNAEKQDIIEWTNAMQDAENHYMRMRARGWKAEHCAQVLPKATKTTLVMTGMESFWRMFFDLRYFEKTGPAHPQAKELAGMIYEKLNAK
jgi:thymidylate synthase (FAD)